jgi:hypothetical protein
VDWTGVLSWWDGWIPAFLLTCVIEVPVYLVMFELFELFGRARSKWGSDRPILVLGWRRAVLLALAVNAVTHPVFWASALQMDSTAGLVLGEPVVTVAEGLMIWAVVRRRPLACLACALVANAASAILGTAISAYVISWAS